MSDNIDELKDIIVQSLEEKGIISKLRAQIRKYVYDTIEEKEYNEKDSSNNNHMNEKLKYINNTSVDKLLLSLVIEYLEFYNLDYTKNVFDSESNIDNSIIPSRNELISTLSYNKINNNKPVLYTILENMNNTIANNNNTDNKYNNKLLRSPRHELSQSASLNNENINNISNISNDIESESSDIENINKLEKSYLLRKNIEEERLSNLEKKIKEHEQLEKLDILKTKKNESPNKNDEISLSNITAPTVVVPTIALPVHPVKVPKLAIVSAANQFLPEKEEKKIDKVEEKKNDKVDQKKAVVEEKKVEKLDEKKGRDVLDIISSAPLEKRAANLGALHPINKGPVSLSGLPPLKGSNVRPLVPINARKPEVEASAPSSKIKISSANPYDEGESLDSISQSFELSQSEEPEHLTTFAYSNTAKLTPISEPRSFAKDLPKVAPVVNTVATIKLPIPAVSIPAPKKTLDDEYDEDIEEDIEEELDDFEVDNGEDEGEIHYKPTIKNPYQNDRIIKNESELNSFDYIEKRH